MANEDPVDAKCPRCGAMVPLLVSNGKLAPHGVPGSRGRLSCTENGIVDLGPGMDILRGKGLKIPKTKDR